MLAKTAPVHFLEANQRWTWSYLTYFTLALANKEYGRG